MTWHTGRLGIFDTETTGINTETARIITACIGTVGGGQPPAIETWLADPGVDIPAEATAVHGITTEHAQAHGKPAALVVAELLDTLTDLWAAGVPLVVMNAAYDLTLLDREAARHGLGELTVTGPVIDPMVIDRHVDRWRRGKRTLTDLARHYQVPLGRAHSAREDALAAARVAWRIGHRHPELTELTTSELHAAQEVWHAEHAADFAAYLRRQGKPADDVSPEWPVRSRAADLAGAR